MHIRERNEQRDIQILIETLESQWKKIRCFAPIRLLRLQFERIENVIVKEFEQAENELNDELKELERQRDTSEILQRHNERFQINHFHPTIEIHMRDLHTFANDLKLNEHEQILDRQEREQLDRRTTKLNDYWKHMQTKIENVKRKLQTVPKKWQDFEEK